MDVQPGRCVKLAQEVYAVNGGDDMALQLFLQNKEFADSGSRQMKVLKAKVGGRIFRAAEDAFGLAAIGQGSFQNQLFLIFRGTTKANNKADFITDARIGLTSGPSGWSVHIGFNHTFTSMLPEIRAFISSLKEPITTVHCIGHSLGGAVATLAADWSYANICKDVKLYTFGQPRVGLTGYAMHLTQRLGKENIHRVYHTTDPVPMVPVFPYAHSPLPGMGHRIDSEHHIASAAAHSINLYIASTKGKQWQQLERGLPKFDHEDAIADWLHSNRDQNPNSPKTFEYLERAIVWLIAKCFAQFINVAQLAFMGVHTFLDKLAWLLSTAWEWAEDSAKWVKLFVKKVMRILGVPTRDIGDKPSRSFLRYILTALLRRSYELAQRAIRQIH
ncbi:lipase family protein [Teredinibacter turnerae]|uniref:lipase family protein n=1 Tax=Teredinibacter turnerae TaxID=2426 RepID=UPI0003F921DD|nr:lipase family protein [Teredinibacter turnerae]